MTNEAFLSELIPELNVEAFRQCISPCESQLEKIGASTVFNISDFVLFGNTWNILRPGEDVGPLVWRVEDKDLDRIPNVEGYAKRFQVVLADVNHCTLSIVVYEQLSSSSEVRNLDKKKDAFVRRLRILLQREISKLSCDTKDDLLIKGDGKFNIRAVDWETIGTAFKERLKHPDEEDQRHLPPEWSILFALSKRGSSANTYDEMKLRDFEYINFAEVCLSVVDVAVEQQLEDHFLFFDEIALDSSVMDSQTLAKPEFSNVGLLVGVGNYTYNNILPNDYNICSMRQCTRLFHDFPSSNHGFFETPSIAKDLLKAQSGYLSGTDPSDIPDMRLVNILGGRIDFFEDAVKRKLTEGASTSARTLVTWQRYQFTGDMKSLLGMALTDAQNFITEHIFPINNMYAVIEAESYKKAMLEVTTILFRTIRHGVESTQRLQKCTNKFSSECIASALKFDDYAAIFVAESLISLMVYGNCGAFSKDIPHTLAKCNFVNLQVSSWPFDEAVIRKDHGKLRTTFRLPDLIPDCEMSRLLVIDLYSNLYGTVQCCANDDEAGATGAFRQITQLLLQECQSLNGIVTHRRRSILELLWKNARAAVGYRYRILPTSKLLSIVERNHEASARDFYFTWKFLEFMRHELEDISDFDCGKALQRSIENEMTENEFPFVCKLPFPKTAYIFVPLDGLDMETILCRAFLLAFDREVGSRRIPVASFITPLCNCLRNEPSARNLFEIESVLQLVNELLDSPLPLSSKNFKELPSSLQKALDIRKESTLAVPHPPPQDRGFRSRTEMSMEPSSTSGSKQLAETGAKKQLLSRKRKNPTAIEKREKTVVPASQQPSTPLDNTVQFDIEVSPTEQPEPIRTAVSSPDFAECSSGQTPKGFEPNSFYESPLRTNHDQTNTVINDRSNLTPRPVRVNPLAAKLRTPADSPVDQSFNDDDLHSVSSRQTSLSQVSIGYVFRGKRRTRTSTQYDHYKASQPRTTSDLPVKKKKPRRPITDEESKQIFELLREHDFLKYMRSFRTAILIALKLFKDQDRSAWSVFDHIKTRFSPRLIEDFKKNIGAELFNELQAKGGKESPEFDLIHLKFGISKEAMEDKRLADKCQKTDGGPEK